MENEHRITKFPIASILQGITFLGVVTTAAKSVQTLLCRHKVISFCTHSLEVLAKEAVKVFQAHFLFKC